MENLEDITRFGVAIGGFISGFMLWNGLAKLEWRFCELNYYKELYDKGKLKIKPTLWNLGQWRKPYNFDLDYYQKNER